MVVYAECKPTECVTGCHGAFHLEIIYGGSDQHAQARPPLVIASLIESTLVAKGCKLSKDSLDSQGLGGPLFASDLLSF